MQLNGKTFAFINHSEKAVKIQLLFSTTLGITQTKAAQNATNSSVAMKSSVVRTSTTLWMTGGLLLATLIAIAYLCLYSTVNHHVVQDIDQQE